MKLKKAIQLINERGVTAYEISKNTGLNEAGVRRILKEEVANPQRKSKEAIINFANSLLNTIETNTNSNTIKVGNIEVNVDEFALAAAQNMDLLKEKPVFYNTFVIEAIKLIKEAQKGDGTIDVSKLVGRR